MTPDAWSIGPAYEQGLTQDARRRSGAYYTPRALAEDIVERTLGPLLERCQTPDEVLRLRVLDPACGGGVFLLAAQERLARAAGVDRSAVRVHGIDLDPGAVEACRRALGDGGDVREGDALFDEQLTAAAPFDAVVGNPPYLSVDATYGRNSPRAEALRRGFPEVWSDKSDLQAYFLARAVSLCRGEVGLLVSRAFLEAFKATRLRAWLAKHAAVREIVDFRGRPMVPGAGVATAVVRLSTLEAVPEARVERDGEAAFTVPQFMFGADSWAFADGATERLWRRIDAAGTPLGELLTVGQGMQTGLNAAFCGLPPEVVAELPRDAWLLRARNSDIAAWSIADRGEAVLLPHTVERFGDLPPAARQHLERHRPELEARAAFRRGDCEWWRFTWPLHASLIRRPRLLCPYMAGTNRFALDEEARFLGLTDTTVLYDAGQPEPLPYLCALLNSRLLTRRYRTIGKLRSAGVYEYFWNGVSRLPIPRLTDATSARIAELADLAGRRMRGEAVDEAIERGMYTLYGLTDEDVALASAGASD